jgi:hypothetical protein
VADQDPLPPPSPDPGNDPERILREIGEQKPKLGCLGATVSGGWALVGIAGLAAGVVYLISRCGS